MIGVVGGSPQIYALALSTTVEQIPAVWQRAQRHPIEPISVPSSALCKEVISARRRGRHRHLAAGGLDAEPRSRAVYHRAAGRFTKDSETGRRNVGTYRLQMKERAAARDFMSAARSMRRAIIRQYDARKDRHAGGDRDRRRSDHRACIDQRNSPTAPMRSPSPAACAAKRFR